MFHRIGGAVHRVFAGVTTRTPQHPATPPNLTQAGQQTLDSPAPPRRPRAPRRPPAAPSEAPPLAQPEAPTSAQSVAQPETPPEAQPRRGWFARWFGRRRRQAALSLPPFSDSDSDGKEDNTPFTPENHPGLSPEFCDFFNTRIDDCDPEMLHLVLAVIATLVAESLPPELSADPRAIIADLWDRLREPSDETTADAKPDQPAEATPDSLTDVASDTQPDDALANQADAAPDEQPGDAPAGLMATTPDEPPDDASVRPDNAVPEASPPPPARPLPEAPATAAPKCIAAAVAEDPAIPAALPRPGRHSRAYHRHRGRIPRDTSRRRLRGCRLLPRLGRRGSPPCPPPRRLCYAACAGPP